MAAHSFTAGADYGIHAATLTGFRGGSTGTSIDIIASGGTTMLETAKNGAFAIGITGRDTIVANVGVDRERAAAKWNVVAGIGEFTGSFIITL